MSTHLSSDSEDEARKEFDRLLELADYDLDYAELNQHLGDLTRLAAKVAGTPISVVNIIDAVSQWTVARHGTEAFIMPRENSVCNYTIRQDSPLEIKNMLNDEHAKVQDYVTGEAQLRYYYGIPLEAGNGKKLGTLCVFDREEKELSPEKVELLSIIAREVSNRLHTLSRLKNLEIKLSNADDRVRKTSHDIRGPLGGIMQLSKIIKDQGAENSLDDVLELIDLIYNGSRSLLELADELLTEGSTVNENSPVSSQHFTVEQFRDKLKELFTVQAASKDVNFSVTAEPDVTGVQFPGKKKMQIAGNLISNAIKFTPAGGIVKTELTIIPKMQNFNLRISVSDTGVGISEERIQQILADKALSTTGTAGERGFCFGLPLVTHLVESLNGTIDIHSSEGEGTEFVVEIPV